MDDDGHADPGGGDFAQLFSKYDMREYILILSAILGGIAQAQ